jgi:hypothetical protein
VASWASGQPADDLPRAESIAPPVKREAFTVFIAGDKERAPYAAMAFQRRLGHAPG